MAGTLSTILTAYRADLAQITGLSELAQMDRIDDAPVSKKKVFALTIETFGPRLGKGGVMGGGHVDYEATLLCSVRWVMPASEEAMHNTIADDLESIYGVLLKASNRQNGQLSQVGMQDVSTARIVSTSPNQIIAEIRAAVAYRLTQNVT